MAHELSVEGEKVIERDSHGNVLSTKDYSNVHRGYLAASHNPRVSDEARDNAEHMLHDLEAAHGDSPSKETKKHHSSSTSDSAGSPEKHTRSHDEEEKHKGSSHKNETHEEEVHRHRQIAGYKSALKRDGVSEEAREHARQMLKELGADEE